MDYIFYGIIIAVFAYVGFRILSKGGISGALFGAAIQHTLGEISLDSGPGLSDMLRVHALANGNIGIERTTKAVLGFSTTAISLTPDQARSLRALLERPNV